MFYKTSTFVANKYEIVNFREMVYEFLRRKSSKIEPKKKISLHWLRTKSVSHIIYISMLYVMWICFILFCFWFGFSDLNLIGTLMGAWWRMFATFRCLLKSRQLDMVLSDRNKSSLWFCCTQTITFISLDHHKPLHKRHLVIKKTTRSMLVVPIPTVVTRQTLLA